MILLDASVLVDYFRSPTDRVLRLFEENEAAICGATKAEILAGARKPADLDRITLGLNVLGYVEFPEALWDQLGSNLSLLRTAGVVVPFPDALIATIAIERGVELWTRDAHFTQIQRVLPRLRLFQEPAE